MFMIIALLAMICLKTSSWVFVLAMFIDFMIADYIEGER